MMRVLAVCRGTAQPIATKSGKTGHFKTPVQGAVQVSREGIEDDTIVDREHHGGPEQAIYIFAEADRLWWEAKLERPLPAGYFGENLLIEGVESAALCLGDIFEIGRVKLQVTSPRIPCTTFTARTGRADAAKLFYEAQRPGAYARVLRGGTIEAFDQAKLSPFEGARITLAEDMSQYRANFPDPNFLKRLLTVPAHEAAHRIARQKLAALDSD